MNNFYSDADVIADDYSSDFDYSGDWKDPDDISSLLDENIQENFNNETQQLLEQF